MMWYNKERATPFDAAPVEGLYFLDGDALARGLKGYWCAGQKYPMIAFPSGMDCPLWISDDPNRVGTVHLFGEMDLPYRDTPENVFQTANMIAEQCGYLARRVGETRLEVIGQTPEERLRITYDPETGHMINVEKVKDNTFEPPVHPGHVLINDDIREKLPVLYSNEDKGLEAIAPVKYFTPDSNWTWYASEGSPVDEDGYYDTDKEKTDFVFFGLVAGLEIELGYFSLSELQSARGPLGLPVERDLYYQPKSLKELMEWHRKERGE